MLGPGRAGPVCTGRLTHGVIRSPSSADRGLLAAAGGEEILMGYGFGGFLLVVGLVLALAVTDRVSGVDLTMVGWIMALVGALLIVLTAVTVSRGAAPAVGRHHDPQRRHPDRQRAAYRDLSLCDVSRWSSTRHRPLTVRIEDRPGRPTIAVVWRSTSGTRTFECG